ncbi:hypothetical protein ACFW9L_35455, partial [Streptomyces sp. NPDC059517]|uniref:hypothetical protein n=1 Tax=Streptomyces sp. NPDC059517 TaxID=3346855 RepID=UPI0036B4F5A0
GGRPPGGRAGHPGPRPRPPRPPAGGPRGRLFSRAPPPPPHDVATKEEQEPSSKPEPDKQDKPERDKQDKPEPDEPVESGEPEETPAPDGAPVFEASDRRAKIIADHKGVRLTLDDQEAEFRWDEIGAVETESPRFGKRFTITVHTPDRRWYPLEIEAKSRADFKAWETDLDEVLDTYFEEAEAEPAAEAEPEESKTAEPTP